MNAAHFHLVLTHFPIVGFVVALGMLIYAQSFGKHSLKKVALFLIAMSSLLVVPIFLSGEGAEKIMERVPGISENVIEKHEEMAEKAMWFVAFIGLVSVIILLWYFKKVEVPKKLTYAIVLLTLFGTGVLAKVGNLGGKIRHSEIRSNVEVQSNSEAQQLNGVHKDHDDDDD